MDVLGGGSGCRALIWLTMSGAALAATEVGAEPVPGPSAYSARAYCVESGRLLYTEHHTEVWEGSRLVGQRVRYRAPGGGLLAEKEIDYTDGVLAPSFELVDRRDGYREGARQRGDEIELFSGRKAKAFKSKVSEAPPNAVLDAGFHRFVQQNLAALQQGERLTFAFGVPAEGRFFRFRVEKTEELEVGGEKAMGLQMEPANRFLRLLVSPIRLTYSLDGRLLEFEGISNINDERGKSYSARIVFDYPEPGERLASRTPKARHSAGGLAGSAQ